MGLFIEHLSFRILLTMIPLEIIQGSRPGTRSGIVRAPAGLPGSPTSRIKTPQAPSRVPYGGRAGTLRAFLRNLSPCPWRIPTARARRAPAGQFTGLIRGLFLAGARVIFKLVLKVTRGPRGMKKMDVGTAKKRPKQPGKNEMNRALGHLCAHIG